MRSTPGFNVADSLAGSSPESWYAPAEGEVQQGELLRGFGFGQVVDSSTLPPSVALTTAEAVVLTQSCDIPKPTQEFLLVAMVLDYATVLASEPNSEIATRRGRTNLARGFVIAQFLLPPLVPWGWSWCFVDFRKVFSVPKHEVLASANAEASRFILVPPYREHLAQAFARFMMRVGLQEPLKQFESWA
jgi:hypothetical protein